MAATNSQSNMNYKSWIFIVLGGALLVAFAVVTYDQRRQVSFIQARLDSLEVSVRAKRSVVSRDVDIEELVRRHVDLQLNKRQLSSAGFETFIKDLISTEVHLLEAHCSNSSVLCFQGPKGEKGDGGTKGDSGVAGPVGQMGIPGIKGDSGPMGGSGPAGPKGDKGDRGIAGVKGDSGRQGLTGTQGPRGDKGEKGDQGQTGSSGPPGPKGDSGYGGGPLAPQPQDCCLKLSYPSRGSLASEVIHAAVGDKVLIPCKAAGYPPPSVTWTPPIAQLGTNRYTETKDGLFLSGVQITDNGKTFQCKLSNIFGTTTKQIRLDVTSPIDVTVTPTNPTFLEGTTGDVVLRCTYKGYPQPSVVWIHTQLNGQAPVVTKNIDNSVPGVSTLTIHNPTSADGGTYICRATNAGGSKEASSKLNVSGAPHFLKAPINQTVPIGSTVTIRCDVSALPPANVSWIFPNNEIRPRLNVIINPDNSLSITHADNLNEGGYTCVARNKHGTSQQTGYLQTVNAVHVTLTPATNSLQNPYVSLECKASGDPVPTITWSKLDGNIDRTDTRYVLFDGDFLISGITPATKDKDSGVYVCTASNGQSTDSKQAIVYKTLASIDCDTQFTACSSTTGAACGATCPAGCASNSGLLFGYKDYTANSVVCKAAIQSGLIDDKGGLVTWSMRDGSVMSFQGTTQHGIQSSSTGPIHNAASLFIP